MGGDGLPLSRGGGFHLCELASTATHVGLSNLCELALKQMRAVLSTSGASLRLQSLSARTLESSLIVPVAGARQALPTPNIPIRFCTNRSGFAPSTSQSDESSLH